MRKLTVLTLLLLLAHEGSEAASLKLGRRYRDESNGFQIQPPAKWEQVPTKFQDVAQIGKWVAKRAKRGWYTAEMHVLRFLKSKAIEDVDSPAEAVERGIPGYSGMLRYQPKDVWAFVKRRMFGGANVQSTDAAFRMSRKELKATVKVFHGPLRGTGRDATRSQLMVCAAQIETIEESDSSFGIVFFATVADEKDMLATFKRIITRFRVLEDDAEDDEGGGPTDADIFVDSEKKPDAWRAARKAKLIKGWSAIDTANYLIVYNSEVKRPLIKKVALHIEAIRTDVYEKLFPPTREVKAISVVRVCKDRAEYHRYGGPGGSAGYWARGDEELVFYQDKSNRKDSLRVLYHEAFHQYIHYAVGEVAPHSWFNEGHGDYFAGHNYRSGKFKSDVFRWRTGTIATALGQKTYVPLRKFLKYSQGEYYADAGLCYAQGWSLVYFLREVERRKIKKYQKYWGLLDRYFEAIKKNVKKVQDEGLGGMNETPPGSAPGDSGFGGLDGDDEEAAAAPKPTLPSLPGLDGGFPGERPELGAGAVPEAKAKSSGRTVAGPVITGTQSALDVAVDEVFLNNRLIDIEQLEKDWIAFSK